MRRRSLLRLTAVSLSLVLTFCAAAWAASAAWKDSQQKEDRARFLGSFRWTMPESWFGGLSGLEVSANGMGFVAITDRSHLVTGRFWREEGRITGIEPLRNERLRDVGGARMPEPREDSEGLAFGAGETYYVSFESPHFVLEYSPAGVRELVNPVAFRSFRYNSSFEALALDAAGSLLVISESPARDPQVDRIWQWSGTGGWRGFGAYPEQEDFLPVGADFGPDGRLYVLERKFLSIGFRSRLRRFSLGPQGLTGGEVLMTSALAQHDNLEGLSVWRGEDGQLRATMISDDNFFWVQRTEVVEYALPD